MCVFSLHPTEYRTGAKADHDLPINHRGAKLRQQAHSTNTFTIEIYFYFIFMDKWKKYLLLNHIRIWNEGVRRVNTYIV